MLSDGDTDVTVTAGDTIIVWGLQVEASSVATSYIPTLAATVTRAVDNITAALSSIPTFSAISNYFQTRLLANDVNGSLWFGVDDGTTGNKIIHYNNTGSTLDWLVTSATVTQATVGGLGNPPATIFKASGSAATNSFNHALNGTAGTRDVAGSMPVSPTTFRLGGNQGVSTGYTGNMFVYFMVTLPRAMADSELQSIST